MPQGKNKSEDTKRRAPFIWASWITGLLSGEHKCQFAAWYRAHFAWVKRIDPQGDFDSAAWNADHAQMIEARVAALRRDPSWTVIRVEEENRFELAGAERANGEKGKLVGVPDIVAVRPKLVTILDEKGGRRKESDTWQVKLYQWALGRTTFRNQAVAIEGVVEYKADTIVLGTLTPPDEANIKSVLAMVGGDLEPPRAPSIAECRFCNIQSCPERMEATVAVGSAADIF